MVLPYVLADLNSTSFWQSPPEVYVLIVCLLLQNVDNWNFDTFSLNGVCKGAPLRYIGYELLTRHGCLHKYKVNKIKVKRLLPSLHKYKVNKIKVKILLPSLHKYKVKKIKVKRLLPSLHKYKVNKIKVKRLLPSLYYLLGLPKILNYCCKVLYSIVQNQNRLDIIKNICFLLKQKFS